MHADLIFAGGRVFTVDAADRIVSAVAVKDGRILAVGTDAEVLACKGPSTAVVELKGRALLPGLIDSHCHVSLMGLWGMGVDCKWPNVNSIADIQRLLKAEAERTPAGKWVRGRGYNHHDLAEKRHPTRWDLDAICLDKPVFLGRTCAHISVVNSRALEIAGIGPDTPDPVGGEIQRDERGVPTGVLIEKAHMDMLRTAMFAEDELREGYRQGARELLRNGITSAHDAGGYGPFTYGVMASMANSADPPLRLYTLMWSMTDVNEFLTHVRGVGLTTGIGNERFRMGPYKIMVDGSSSGPTVATKRPYDSMPDYSGILYYTQEEINEHYRWAHRNGFQLTAHCQGDLGIEMTINGIEQAMRDSPRQGTRHRLEHAGMCFPELMDRVEKLKLIPIAQPVFFHEFGDGYVVNYGYDRASRMFPCKSYLRRGIPVCGSSDSPVTDCNPLLGMSVAMTRKTRTGQVVGPEECITLNEAVRIYTANGAYAEFAEGYKGTLAPGKLADLAVLGSPLVDVPADEVKDIPVDMTVVGGQVVYQRS